MKNTVATLAAIAGLTAFADGGATWYLKDGDYSFNNKWIVNAAGWTDNGTATGTPSGAEGDPLSPEDYYVVNKSHALRSNINDVDNVPTTFTGKRLTFGEDGNKNAGYLTCYSRGGSYVDFGSKEGQEGAYLYKGYFSGQKNYKQYHYVASLTGKMTLTAPESAPFVITANKNDSNWTHGFQVTGTTFRAESGTALQFGGPLGGDYSASNLTAYLYCDMSKFFGKIIVKPCCTSLDDYPGFTSSLYLGDGGFPGSLELQAGASLVTTSAQCVVTLANATFATGSTIKLPTAFTGSGAASCARVAVTNSLTLGDDVAIEITPPANGLTNRLAVLVSKNGGIDKTKFSFKFPASLSTWFESVGGAWFEVETNQATGEQTLYAVCVPLVKMVYSDAGSKDNGPTRLAVTNAAAWSDGKLPHAGAHYLIASDDDVTGRSGGNTYFYTASTNEFVFPGDSLTLGSHVCSRIFAKQFTVPTLRLLDSCEIWSRAGTTFDGTEVVADSGVVRLSSFNGTTMTFSGDLSGAAEVRVGTVTSTSVPGGTYKFNGGNSDFVGTLVVSQYVQGVQYGATYSERYQRFYLYNSTTLGGALPAFNPEAAVLSEFGRFTLNNDVSISTNLNRGLAVYGNGVVDTAAHSLNLGMPLTMDGTLYKLGAGTLRLDANRHAVGEGGGTIVVTNGTLAVAAADAINGIAVSFAPGTALVLKTNLADEELTRYGIRNVGLAEPFVLAEGMAALPLTVDATGGGELPRGHGGTVGILTVSDSATNRLDAAITVPRTYRGFKFSSVKVHDDENGWTTYAARYEPTGCVISIR